MFTSMCSRSITHTYRSHLLSFLVPVKCEVEPDSERHLAERGSAFVRNEVFRSRLEIQVHRLFDAGIIAIPNDFFHIREVRSSCYSVDKMEISSDAFVTEMSRGKNTRSKPKKKKKQPCQGQGG